MKRLAITFLAIAALATASFAQQAIPTPLDPNVRTGKLDNGLTYFIRHNEKPAERANFYIAQKVGSILEDDSQRGLAHFLEHMCFNGTKNFPGKDLLNYMEHNGVKFGENVNAWTSIEQTVYMLTNVPTTNPGLIDSSLLILHDWSSFVSLESEEIDKERGVILEEMRQGQTADMRIYDKMLPEIYPNSPYGYRLPIGTEEVVANFDHQALRDYYHKWYRPDLQGLIIIGDVDVDQIEKRIIEIFADIPAPENPAERTRFQVADNDEPLVSINSDVEQTSYEVGVFYKHDVTPNAEKGNVNYWLQNIFIDLISEMYSNRLDELVQKPNPPFIYGGGGYGTFMISDTKDAWQLSAYAKDLDGVDEALTAIVTESNRMAQYGFTQSEFDRTKANILKRYETQYEERNKQETGRYFYPMLNHFLSNEPLMGIETEYMLIQQILPNLPLEAVNSMAKEMVSDNNIVLILTAPAKEGETLPTKEEYLDMFEKANNISVEPYVEEVSNEPLIAKLPKQGKIAKRETIAAYDATMLTLKNGIKVIYKTTDYKDDEILMSAYSFGGYSAIDNCDPYTLQNLNSMINISGLGNFSAIDLRKALAGKRAYVNASISTYTEGLSGSCSVKDLETLMQLTYLSFTNMYKDDEAFESFISRTKASLENAESDPMTTFRDSLYSVMYDSHPIIKRMKAEDYDKVDYNKGMELIAKRFADPNNFVFTFVGNIDPETFEPMVTQYLGALKAKKNKESWKDFGFTFPKRDNICHYERNMETPKATCYMIYNGEMEATFENELYMSILTDILDIVYTEKIREDEGGTYGVGVNGDVTMRPEGSYYMLIGFETNKEMHEKLMNIAKAELENIATVGPREQDLKKVKEFMIKKHSEDLENNHYWMGRIQGFLRDGIDRNAPYNSIIEGASIETIRDFARKVISGYHKEVVQLPTD